MTSNICYVCDAETDWRNDFSKIKSQHSQTPIVELLQRFIGDFKTQRNLRNESNRICIECITKIDEYDWTCVLMIERENELRNLLLNTEKLYKQNDNNDESDFEWKYNDDAMQDELVPKIEIEEFEPSNEFTTESNEVLIEENDSDFDYNSPNDSEDEYIPIKQIQEKRERKKKASKTVTETKSTANERKSKRGRKKGVKMRSHNFHAKCLDCGLEFHRSIDYTVHRREHRKERELLSGTSDYKCVLCSYILDDQKSFDAHLELHKNTKVPNECVLCHKAFSQRGNLGLHMKIHQDVRNLICDICGKTFLHPTSFEAHTNYHNNVRKHKCPECPKKFVMSSHLNRHLQTHKKDKPYSCSVCGNRFGYATNLRIHQKMHEGMDKNEVCSICGANYARKTNLIQHMNKMHGTTTPHIVIENGLRKAEEQVLTKKPI